MPHNPRSLDEKGVAHLVTLLAVFVLVALVASSHITRTELLKNQSSPDVLGDSQEDHQSKGSEHEAEQPKPEDHPQESVQNKQPETPNQNSNSDTKPPEPAHSGRPKIEDTFVRQITTNPQTGVKKSETEIETASGTKIKTKVEDNGKTKVEIEHQQLKLKYIFENGQSKIKAENEQGEAVELKDSEISKLENEVQKKLSEDGAKIATGSGKPILVRNKVAALTDLPLSVDVATNQLVINTPQGTKTVAVLPDQALRNLLDAGVMNRAVGSSGQKLPTDLGQVDSDVSLETKDGEVVYKVKGVKSYKLLGFIPVDTDTTAYVSAETGQPISKDQTLLSQFVDLLSP